MRSTWTPDAAWSPRRRNGPARGGQVLADRREPEPGGPLQPRGCRVRCVDRGLTRDRRAEPPLRRPGRTASRAAGRGRHALSCSTRRGHRFETRVGAGVYYHGLEVGKITRVALTPAARFQLNIFVFSPYDHLVKADTRFFRAKPLQIEFTGSGVDGELGPGSSPLTGGVEFGHARRRRPSALKARVSAPNVPVLSRRGPGRGRGHRQRGVTYQAVFRQRRRRVCGAARPSTSRASRSAASCAAGWWWTRRGQVVVTGAVTVEIEPESLGLGSRLSGEWSADRRRRRADRSAASA